jgi:hypothetical protein
MFTLNAMREVANALPFVPFRIWTTEGDRVDVLSRQLVVVGKRFVCIGLCDGKDLIADRFRVITYSHIARVEA